MRILAPVASVKGTDFSECMIIFCSAPSHVGENNSFDHLRDVGLSVNSQQMTPPTIRGRVLYFTFRVSQTNE